MTDLQEAARRALAALDDLIHNTTDPGVEALGARHELAAAIINVPSRPADRRSIRDVMGPADGQQKMRLLADLYANTTPVTAPADGDLRDRIAEVRKIVKRLIAHAKGFQDVLDEPDRDPWARLVRADIDELVAVLAALPADTDQTAAPSAPADQDARRERYAAAMASARRDSSTGPVLAHERMADAAMTVADAENARLQVKVQELTAALDRACRDAVVAGRTDEAHRLALSEALGLGTGAPWDAIRDQAAAFRARLSAPDRDRIVTLDPADPMAQAIAEGHRTVIDTLADAVLAVVPSADRAGVLRAAAEQAGEKWTADLLKRRASEAQSAGEGR
ncbi:hypothetical protein ACWCRC_32915 [Streptomyces sp. NPDC001940]